LISDVVVEDGTPADAERFPADARAPDLRVATAAVPRQIAPMAVIESQDNLTAAKARG